MTAQVLIAVVPFPKAPPRVLARAPLALLRSYIYDGGFREKGLVDIVVAVGAVVGVVATPSSSTATIHASSSPIITPRWNAQLRRATLLRV